MSLLKLMLSVLLRPGLLMRTANGLRSLLTGMREVIGGSVDERNSAALYCTFSLLQNTLMPGMNSTLRRVATVSRAAC